MLRMLSLDVADTCYWVLQILNFNVTDVEFRCCRLVILSFVSKRTEGGLRMLDIACNTVATWSQHGEERRKTPDVGCCKQPCLQHFHNTFATFTR
jgi:hypothetical protein